MTQYPSAPLRAEVLSVGTELLLGEIVDANAAFLGRELSKRGVTVQRESVVGDNLGRLSAAMREALSRADLLLVSGGLGPTEDDFTREAIAALAGQVPAVSAPLLAQLQAFFAARGRDMPPSNAKQAWLIPWAQSLPNARGTAPGWLVTFEAGPLAGKRIAALPGPPREMQPMFLEEVLPRLRLPPRAFLAVTLRTAGIGESVAAQELGALTLRENPSVATYARASGIDVRVAASAATLSEAQALLQPALAQAQRALQPFIWAQSTPDEAAPTLAQVAAGLLGGRQLALAEAGSSGALSRQLLGQPGVRGATASDDLSAWARLGPPLSGRAGALALAEFSRQQWGSELGLGLVLDGDEAHAALLGPLPRAESLSGLSAHATPPERAALLALTLLWRTLKEDHA